MICYTETQKIQERVFGRNPIKRTHGKVIVFAKVNSKLCFEVGKRVKFVCGVEVFVIFAMGTLYLTVVSGSVRFYQLVLYATLFEARLKQCERLLGAEPPKRLVNSNPLSVWTHSTEKPSFLK